MSSADVRQHGVKGAYVGGSWVDMEDCANRFNISGGSHTTQCASLHGCEGESHPDQCATCPRSRSKHNQSKADGTYDVVVIGAGCIGSAIARELSKYKVSVLMLESADDVTQGATKGNSGIVHAGYDDKPGTNRAKFCWPGNQMFEALDKDLHFGYQKNGSLVMATSKAELPILDELLARGQTNGVKNLRIVQKKELFEMEPYINPKTIAALYSPDAGNLVPYEFAIALAENAVDNGVELRIRREVSAIEVPTDSNPTFKVTAKHWEPKSYVDVIGTPRSGHDQQLSVRNNSLGVAMSVFIGSLAVLGRQSEGIKAAAAAKNVPMLQVVIACVTLSFLAGAFAFVATLALLVGTSSSTKGGNKTTYKADAAAPASVSTGGRKITVDEMRYGGSGSRTAVDGVYVADEEYRATYVLNCAGLGADKIAAMIGDTSFKIKPRLGDYLLLNRDQAQTVTVQRTLFPCPDPVLGKGVLVQTTLWGNLILGPTARDTYLPEVMAETAADIQRFILSKCSELVPSFDPEKVIHGFCGARAKSDRGDWIIEPSKTHGNFIHVAGIDSPGLAGSPAIALEAVKLLKAAGLKAPKNPNFNPKRAPIIVPKDGWKGLKAAKDVSSADKDPSRNVICKCEKVTEQEVLNALGRSLPVDSTQAIRKRTRAGMGHCQSETENYDCECRVAHIVARELNMPVEAVGRRPWPATSTLGQRWINDEEKKELVRLKAGEE